MDDNPSFCVISDVIVLACHDKAFLFPPVTPQVVFTLGVRPGLNSQPIQWRDDMKEKPIFRVSSSPRRGEDQKLYETLPYGRYQEWVKQLGEETSFVQVLTTYCLRRAAGNAISSES